MTVREMHIEINQSMQKVAANLTRKLLSEEIDWVLNKIQNRYIQQSLRPVNFEGNFTGKFKFTDQLKLDALKPITVNSKFFPAYADTTDSGYTRMYSPLPKDYMYLLADSSSTVDVCNEVRVASSNTESCTILKLAQTAKVAAPYYLSGSLTVDGTVVTIPANLHPQSNYTGFQRKADVIFIKDWLIQKLWQNNIEVYWERYGNMYYQGSFIFVGIPTVALVWDGITVTSSEVINNTKTSFNESSTGQIANNRLVDSTSIHDILYTPFYKTSIESPVSELSASNIYVYYNNNTIVKGVYLSYIKIPNTISLSLGTNCDIASEFHQTICDLTVEYIKGQLEDQTGVAIKKADNDTRIIL